MPEVRLIDANALKYEMEIAPLYAVDMYTACAVIDAAPTINPEVRHGNGCSYCKGRAYSKKTLTVITRNMKRVEVVFEYCPACGKKMKGCADNG